MATTTCTEQNSIDSEVEEEVDNRAPAPMYETGKELVPYHRSKALNSYYEVLVDNLPSPVLSWDSNWAWLVSLHHIN